MLGKLKAVLAAVSNPEQHLLVFQMRRSTQCHGQQSCLLPTNCIAQTFCQCCISHRQRKRKSSPSNTENSLMKKYILMLGKSKPSSSPSYVQSSYHKWSYGAKRAKRRAKSFTVWKTSTIYVGCRGQENIVQLFNSVKYNGTTAPQWQCKSRCSGFMNPRWAAVAQSILVTEIHWAWEQTETRP